MEILSGKRAAFMDAAELANRMADYAAVHLDIGTGDGRFARHAAQRDPHCFVIGLDACRENLVDAARRVPDNVLYVIANALALPPELHGLATQVTINFPWGSLLEGLLTENTIVRDSLRAVMCSGAAFEIRLNGGALAEVGWSLTAGAERARNRLAVNGFVIKPPVLLTARDLRDYPTTWAKRLAYGRDPRAVYLHGRQWHSV